LTIFFDSKDNLKYRHPIEKKLEEATKNDNYNCPTRLLQEIADASYTKYKN